jgi:hypothetical protein
LTVGRLDASLPLITEEVHVDAALMLMACSAVRPLKAITSSGICLTAPPIWKMIV